MFLVFSVFIFNFLSVFFLYFFLSDFSIFFFSFLLFFVSCRCFYLPILRGWVVSRMHDFSTTFQQAWLPTWSKVMYCTFCFTRTHSPPFKRRHNMSIVETFRGNRIIGFVYWYISTCQPSRPQHFEGSLELRHNLAWWPRQWRVRP